MESMFAFFLGLGDGWTLLMLESILHSLFVHDIIHTYDSSKNVMQERLLCTKYILCFTISHTVPLSFGLEDFFSDHK